MKFLNLTSRAGAVLVVLAIGGLVGVGYWRFASAPESASTAAKAAAIPEQVPAPRAVRSAPAPAISPVVPPVRATAPEPPVRPDRDEGAEAVAAGATWRTFGKDGAGQSQRPRLSTLLDGKLAASFVTLFELSANEESALQASVDSARARLGRLERENATLTWPGDGSVTITVKPFAEAGGAVYDEFMQGFAQVLGPERNAVFLQFAAEQAERALKDCGTGTRAVTIRRTPEGYALIDAFESLGGNGYTLRAPAGSREAMTALIPSLAPLLPQDF